jgi:hypothetical protein
MIDRETGTKDAAAVLGHSGVGVTEQHYVERAAVAPDKSLLLEALGGGNRPKTVSSSMKKVSKRGVAA